MIVSVFYHSGTFPQIAALTLAGSLVQITTVVLVQLAGRSRVRL